MANSDKGGAAAAQARSPEQETDMEKLPSLFGRLGDDVTKLLDTKLSLLKVEIKEDVNAYIRGGVLIAGGGVVAAIGFALLNVAVAFFVSTLFANTGLSQPAKYALGFVITGALYLIVGGVLVVMMKNRLAAQGIVPERTVEELQKDKEWLKEEL